MSKHAFGHKDSSGKLNDSQLRQASQNGHATITSTGAIIRSNQDLANSKGYKDAVEAIRRIRDTSKR